jgi:chemotaxis protein methyltransferase CheR
LEAGEYSYVRREILNLTGVDLTCYRTQQVQRRLRTYLVRSGHESWSSFFREKRGDSDGLRELKDYLTINVSSFFRDPDKYRYLGSRILPELAGDGVRLRVWSAGCSRGQEAYTLAMMLRAGLAGLRPHEILATDLDRTALEVARAGGPYDETDVANVRPDYLRRYFDRNETGYWVKDDLRHGITFRHANLLSERFGQGYDLIVCRNVVIYFTAEVKDWVYRRFHQALRPGGVLFVGGTEIIPSRTGIGFESVGISFYRRKADG